MSEAASRLELLERLLGGPELAWLRERVRGRILRAGGGPLTGVVVLNTPTAAQRDAVVRLIGAPAKAGAAALRVDLAVVEEVLRRGPWPAGLSAAVLDLTGPVVDRAAERSLEAAGWDGAQALLEEQVTKFDGLGEWWHSWCAGGGLKRAARAEAIRTGQETGPDIGVLLVRRAAMVLAELPSTGEPLSVLAQRVVGDAHALDDKRPLGRLVGAIAAAAFGPDREMSVRDAWAAAGVVLSNVASTVLCLGVTGKPDAGLSRAGGATAAALSALHAAGMPVVLTLDHVRSGGVAALAPGAVVFVCENPTIVEIVAERWSRMTAAPSEDVVLVCTGGQPSTAVVELLQILVEEGAECRYHGDFDWPGLRIAASLGRRVRWSPWRFRATDYRAMLGEGIEARPLTGRPASSPWDPALAEAMTEAGQAVEEEAVAELLARDLLALS